MDSLNWRDLRATQGKGECRCARGGVMRGYDCLVICGPDDDVAGAVSSALDGVARVGCISPGDLAAMHAGLGAEMATLIVSLSPGADLALVESAIRRFRDNRAHLGVVALAHGDAVARTLSLGQIYDAVIDRHWQAAPDLMRRFVLGHRTRVQNRAFRAFLDHSVDGYWIWHVGRDHLEWSDRTRSMTGTTADQTPQCMADFAAMIHPQDLDRVEQAVRNHLNHDAPYEDIELRLRLGAGGYGSFVANGQALRDEAGRAIIMVGSLTDRTLIRRVEQQLEDTQKRFTVLFHQMNDAAVLADTATGLILEANQPAERLWGKPIAELIGTHQTALHPPVLSDEARKAFADHIAALMQNKRDSISVPILRADGTEVPTEISSSLIEIDGRTCILGVFRDIRERVKAERDLRERDAQIQLSSHLASMGTLAAGVAHEINNPLTYVTGNLELLKSLLQDKGITDPDLTEAIDAALTGGRYVREIVSDLKAISRMDSADESCDAAEVLRIASRMAMSDLRHRARLEMDLADLPRVPISSARLSQVVLNVLSNAIRAFASTDPSRNRIAITARQEGGKVHIVIRDNGIGIAPEDLKRVWEPFFTKRPDTGGTGLGLSISRRILKEVDGTLDITSDLGAGTTVTLCLPAIAPDGDCSGQRAAEMPTRTAPRPRLLVVDDDVLVSSVIERMLRKDFDITVHNAATDALAEIRAGRAFDVVLCDIMMPQMDGPALFAEVGDQMPFLFLTGGAVAPRGIAFEKRMAAEGRLVYKPFDAATLRDRLMALAAAAPPEHPKPPPSPARKPAKAPVAEAVNEAMLQDLIAAMGPDLVKRQLSLVLDQVRALCRDAAGLSAGDLMAQAHKMGGAANVMGATGLGAALYRCEDAAAAASPAAITAAITALDGQADALAAVLDRL